MYASTVLIAFSIPLDEASNAAWRANASSPKHGEFPEGESPIDSPTHKDGPAKDDPLGSLISGAAGAASALGSWFKTAAKETAPDLFDKTSKLSHDVYAKTKVAATGAFEKTAVYAKKASFVVEQFVEKQLEEHGVVAKKDIADATPAKQPIPEETTSPFAE